MYYIQEQLVRDHIRQLHEEAEAARAWCESARLPASRHAPEWEFLAPCQPAHPPSDTGAQRSDAHAVDTTVSSA